MVHKAKIHHDISLFCHFYTSMNFSIPTVRMGLNPNAKTCYLGLTELITSLFDCFLLFCFN